MEILKRCRLVHVLSVHGTSGVSVYVMDTLSDLKDTVKHLLFILFDWTITIVCVLDLNHLILPSSYKILITLKQL